MIADLKYGGPLGKHGPHIPSFLYGQDISLAIKLKIKKLPNDFFDISVHEEQH